MWPAISTPPILIEEKIKLKFIHSTEIIQINCFFLCRKASFIIKFISKKLLFYAIRFHTLTGIFAGLTSHPVLQNVDPKLAWSIPLLQSPVLIDPHPFTEILTPHLVILLQYRIYYLCSSKRTNEKLWLRNIILQTFVLFSHNFRRSLHGL